MSGRAGRRALRSGRILVLVRGAVVARGLLLARRSGRLAGRTAGRPPRLLAVALLRPSLLAVPRRGVRLLAVALLSRAGVSLLAVILLAIPLLAVALLTRLGVPRL